MHPEIIRRTLESLRGYILNFTKEEKKRLRGLIQTELFRLNCQGEINSQSRNLNSLFHQLQDIEYSRFQTPIERENNIRRKNELILKEIYKLGRIGKGYTESSLLNNLAINYKNIEDMSYFFSLDRMQFDFTNENEQIILNMQEKFDKEALIVMCEMLDELYQKYDRTCGLLLTYIINKGILVRDYTDYLPHNPTVKERLIYPQLGVYLVPEKPIQHPLVNLGENVYFSFSREDLEAVLTDISQNGSVHLPHAGEIAAHELGKLHKETMEITQQCIPQVEEYYCVEERDEPIPSAATASDIKRSQPTASYRPLFSRHEQSKTNGYHGEVARSQSLPSTPEKNQPKTGRQKLIKSGSNVHKRHRGRGRGRYRSRDTSPENHTASTSHINGFH